MKRNILKFLVFLFLFLNILSLEKALAQFMSLGPCYEKCGVYDPSAGCQCDEKCIIYGDCCKDICKSCPRLSICLAPTLPPYPTGAAVSIQPITTLRRCISHEDCKYLICPQIEGRDTPCCNLSTGTCYCGSKGCSLTTTTIQLIPICRDSDGGKNYYQRGFVTIIEGLEKKWFYDYCSRDVLHEYFCDGNEVKEENYTCLLGCMNGACIRCRDSDYGKNYFVKGNCSYIEGNEIVSKVDYCSSEDILIEYICREEGCIEERFNCSLLLSKVQKELPIKYICNDGRCVPITTTITTTIPNSCEGRCGRYQRGAPCQCDANCRRYGDCCQDFCQACSYMPGC